MAQIKPRIIHLAAVHPFTGDSIVVCLDLSNHEETDRLFKQFARYITHLGYVLVA